MLKFLPMFENIFFSSKYYVLCGKIQQCIIYKRLYIGNLSNYLDKLKIRYSHTFLCKNLYQRKGEIFKHIAANIYVWGISKIPGK